MSGENEQWQLGQRLLQSRFFDGIRAPLSRLSTLSPDHWPSCAQLNAIASELPLTNASGACLRFVAARQSEASALAYESRISTLAEVPTRENWHDLFNALQWLSIPQTKATINAMHVSRLGAEGVDGAVGARGAAESSKRSPQRDVLTMFDESGIIVVSDDASLLDLIRRFQWKALFVERRAEVAARMRFWSVGHGLLEKSLQPFIGLTAKAILLHAPLDGVGSGSLNGADQLAAAWLGNDANLQSSRCLAPLPLLGIPGWDARNEAAQFYDNSDYFRPGYQRAEPRGLRTPMG